MGRGNYTGTAVTSFAVTQAANKAKAAKTKWKKTVKRSKPKKKAQNIVLPKVSTAFGKAKWSASKRDKKKVLSLNAKTGKVKVEKNAKKGTYAIKLEAKVAGTANYAAAVSKVVTVKVTVK